MSASIWISTKFQLIERNSILWTKEFQSFILTGLFLSTRAIILDEAGEIIPMMLIPSITMSVERRCLSHVICQEGISVAMHPFIQSPQTGNDTSLVMEVASHICKLSSKLSPTNP